MFNLVGFMLGWFLYLSIISDILSPSEDSMFKIGIFIKYLSKFLVFHHRGTGFYLFQQE